MTALPAIRSLITHSGSFHADDCLSFCLLRDLFPQAELLRTRDAAILEAAGDDSIVFDVGAVFDPARGRFDHHQLGAPARPCGVGYSSFGLIWQSYGKAWLLQVVPDIVDLDGLWSKIDKTLVRDIDALDTSTLQPDQEGALHPLNVSAMVGHFQTDFDETDPAAETRQFLAAADWFHVMLLAKARSGNTVMRANRIVREAIAHRHDRRWIELPTGMPWHAALRHAQDEDILFVLSPSQGQWYIETVPLRRGSYDKRKDLPASWAGLRDAELAAVTGVGDAVFCHRARFVAAARSREGALALLAQALDA